MPINLKAVATALEGLPQLLTVMKAENIDQSAQEKIEGAILTAWNQLSEALGKPKNEGNFKMDEIVSGLTSVAEDMQAAGADLDLVDRVAAIGEKAARLMEQAVEAAPQTAQTDQSVPQTQEAPQQTTEQTTEVVAPESQQTVEAAPQDAQPAQTIQATEAAPQTAQTVEVAPESQTQEPQASAPQTITKSDLESLFNKFGETVMKRVDDKLNETKTVLAQKAAVATTVPGTSNPTVSVAKKPTPTSIFDSWDMSAAVKERAKKQK